MKSLWIAVAMFCDVEGSWWSICNGFYSALLC